MFVCRLVSGVRSSCDASATKRRCVSIDSSSAPSIVLNAVPRRASSSRPPASAHALARIACLARSARRRAVRRRTGASAVRETSAPRGRAGGDAAERDEKKDEPQAIELVVDVVEAAHGLERDPATVGQVPT